MTGPALPSLIPTLPGQLYTDPGVFTGEQAAIFESLWFCALRSADVAGPGQFRTVQDGRLVSAPNLAAVGDVDRGPYGLRAVALRG